MRLRLFVVVNLSGPGTRVKGKSGRGRKVVWAESGSIFRGHSSLAEDDLGYFMDLLDFRGARLPQQIP
jgi:hypothetical protein